MGDQVYVSPDGGWVRSHPVLTGKSISGNALVAFGGHEVRVPVLVNRVIVFQRPGDYDISIATQRVVSEFRRVEQLDCDPCPATNAVRIHIAERSESDENVLVRSLSRVLEGTHELEPVDDEAQKGAKLEMQREAERVENMADSAEKEAEQKRLMKKISGMVDERMGGIEQRARDRRIAAERLAYLTGDDAVRAKVHFIAMNANRTDADVVSFILINGIAASRNKQLQLDLLEALWRDPEQVPSEISHAALHDSRVLVHETMVKDTGWGPFLGAPAEERKAYWDEYEKDLELIVATLPRRSEENRAKTIDFLKKIGVPNPLNRGAVQ